MTVPKTSAVVVVALVVVAAEQ